MSDRFPSRAPTLLLLVCLVVACGSKDSKSSDDSATCPYEGDFASVEEFGVQAIPIHCANTIRCHDGAPTTSYDECVETLVEKKYTSEKCEWDKSWSCSAAQCIKEWSAQEEYYQVSEPECENEPSPWRPEVCNELYASMNCQWNDGGE